MQSHPHHTIATAAPAFGSTRSTGGLSDLHREHRRPEVFSYLFFLGLIATTFLF